MVDGASIRVQRSPRSTSKIQHHLAGMLFGPDNNDKKKEMRAINLLTMLRGEKLVRKVY